MMKTKPVYNYDLDQCNQAEMYGEHMEFDSLRFLKIAVSKAFLSS